MSVQSAVNRIVYSGNSSTLIAYTIPFMFLDNADIQVFLTAPDGTQSQLTIGTGYTLTGANDPSGGSLKTTVAYGSNFKLTILREVIITQNTSYKTADKFPAASHERALDRITMILQQLDRRVKRTPRFRDTDGETSPLIPQNSAIFATDAQGNITFLSTQNLPQLLGLQTLSNPAWKSKVNLALNQLRG